MATVTEAERLVYTVAETAKLMCLSKGLTYQLCREGKIPTQRWGRRLLVPKAQLMRILSGNSEAGHDNNGQNRG